MGDATAAFDVLFKSGQFIVVLIGIGTVLWKLSAMMARFEMHGEKIERMETGLAEMSKAMTTLAVQTNRLDSQGAQIVDLQKEIADLRRGVGFKQREIDGEWPKR
jgi:hypothetical protein